MSAESVCGIGYKQGAEFLGALERAGFTGKHIQQVTESKGNKLAEAMLVVVKGNDEKPPPPPPDTIIRLDRASPLPWPSWVDKVLNADLQESGPSEYEVATIELWLHEDQENSMVKGQVIYDYLKANGLLVTCGGLRDLLAIQAKGLDFFRQHFRGKSVYGWKSAVRDRAYGRLHVPYLWDDVNRVRLGWDWRVRGGDGGGPALRLASPQK